MSHDHHCTPPAVVDCLLEFFGGPVPFDPCSNKHSIVPARKKYYAGALHLPWVDDAYENPPYSNIEEFTRKGVIEYSFGEMQHWIRLVPSSTSTLWWRQTCGVDPIHAGGEVYRAREPVVAFTKRIAFIDPMPQKRKSGKAPPSGAGSARFDTTLFYTGPSKARFLRVFKPLISWTP